MTTTKQKSKLERMLATQKKQAWDMEQDINWENFNFDLPLLPIGQEIRTELNLTKRQYVVASQLLGLIATQAISEHEKALQIVKRSCWWNPVTNRKLPNDMLHLGEQFFREEAKHSETFARFIRLFANQKGISEQALKSILPQYKDGLFCNMFRLNSKLGGRAVWWLVMLTEEESLDLHRKLRSVNDEVDPLFYQLHELHFQEEVRHISYAPMMLRQLGGKWISRFDYRFAEVVHFIWILNQLRRLKKLKKIRGQHPFFEILYEVYLKLDRLPWRKKTNLLFSKTPYLSPLFRPMRHKAMRVEIKRNIDYPTFFKFNHYEQGTI